MQVHILVLNYNGRALLAECLPSVLDSAASSRHRCDVSVIDNASTDGSQAWITEKFPQVPVLAKPNEGLCSFNSIVPELPGEVAVLLNNDVKLARDCIDRLVAPLANRRGLGSRPCFMTAARCVSFDGKTYEGQKTAVSWRWGIVSATSLFPGHEAGIYQTGPTASAGAAIAVDRRVFETLGGFDSLYLPGRIEDLDLAYRGYQAGYQALYVPDALAFHLGMGSFGPSFGKEGCDAMAFRNTLLFTWKNLRHPLHWLRHLAGLMARLVAETLLARNAPNSPRWPTFRALAGALARLGELRRTQFRTPGTLGGEREFFHRFHPTCIHQPESLGVAVAQHRSSPETIVEMQGTGDRE